MSEHPTLVAICVQDRPPKAQFVPPWYGSRSSTQRLRLNTRPGPVRYAESYVHSVSADLGSRSTFIIKRTNPALRTRALNSFTRSVWKERFSMACSISPYRAMPATIVPCPFTSLHHPEMREWQSPHLQQNEGKDGPAVTPLSNIATPGAFAAGSRAPPGKSGRPKFNNSEMVHCWSWWKIDHCRTDESWSSSRSTAPEQRLRSKTRPSPTVVIGYSSTRISYDGRHGRDSLSATGEGRPNAKVQYRRRIRFLR